MKTCRKLIFALGMLSLSYLAQAGALVGRFQVPETLKWTRESDADAAFGGYCIEVKGADGIENLIVLENDPTAVDGEIENELMTAAFLSGFEKALGASGKCKMTVAGLPWEGFSQYNEEDGAKIYMGCIGTKTELFRVYLVRRSKKPLSTDLVRFLKDLKILKPGEELPTLAKTPEAAGQTVLASEAVRTSEEASVGVQEKDSGVLQSNAGVQVKNAGVQTKEAGVQQKGKAAQKTEVLAQAEAAGGMKQNPVGSETRPSREDLLGGVPGQVKKGPLPEWIRALPAIPKLEPVSLAPGVDFSACNQAEYEGLVRTARESCREILGQMSPEQSARFDAKWEPMLAFPAKQCRDYLEQVIPLLEQVMSVKVALVENLAINDQLWEEAGYALAYDEEAGKVLMQKVATQATLIATLKKRAEVLGEQLGALGDPPNPGVLQQAAVRRHKKAMTVLDQLLGGTRKIEGAYDMGDTWFFEYQDKELKQPYYNLIKDDPALAYDVFLPFQAGPDGALWYYTFSKRERSKKPSSGSFIDLSGIDFGGGPESYTLNLLEESGSGWANYSIDEEEPDAVTVDLYKPSPSGLMLEEYEIKGGKLVSAYSKALHQRPLTPELQCFPEDVTLKSVKQEVAGQLSELREAELGFKKGKQIYERFLQKGGTLPEFPVQGERELYWVLKSAKVTPHFPASKSLGSRERTNAVALNGWAGGLAGRWTVETTEDEYIPVVQTRDDPRTERISDPSSEFSGPVQPGETRTVVKKQNKTVEVQWSPAPLIVPDGGYWPMQIKGSGEWEFSFAPSFDKKGEPQVFMQFNQSMPGGASVLLFPSKEAGKKGLQELVHILPSSASSCQIRSRSEGGDHKRFVFFESSWLRRFQKEYPLTLLVQTEAGWMRQDLVYEYKLLSVVEAAALMQKTAQADAEAASMLAAVEAQAAPVRISSELSPQLEQAKSSKEERRAFHKANIAFCNQELTRLEAEIQKQQTLVFSSPVGEAEIAALNNMQFRLACLRSNIMAEEDRITELDTKEVHFRRTPFDELCREQVRYKANEEVKQFDAAAKARRKAELLLGKLGGEQREVLRGLINKVIAEGGALDPEKWTKLNHAMQEQYLGTQQQKVAAVEEDLAWKSCQLDAVENIKTGADTAMTALSFTGGPLYLTALYQTGNGFAEGGILEGVKRGLTTYSDAADIAVSGYEGWKQGGWLGMVEQASWSVLMNKGPEVAMNRIKLRSLRKEGLAGVGLDMKKPPIDLSATRAAQFKQELEYGESMAEDFFRSHKELRTAELRGGSSREELTRLRMAVRQKAAAVAHSMPAKSYLKYKATPIKGKAYTETMDGILEDTAQAYNWEMRNQGFNDQKLFSCRNASSVGAGMDADMALKQQPDFLPKKMGDGSTKQVRNPWLTQNGAPVSLKTYQEEGSKVFQEAYKKVTGGYHAKSSFVDMTTSIGKESYPDLKWLNLPKAGKHSDTAQVTRKLDEFFGKIDPKKVPDSLKITVTKAEIMYKEHPELRSLGSMMESCRGTAKDIDTKFIPLLESQIRKLEKLPPNKLSSLERGRLQEFKETRSYLGECLTCFEEIGQGKIPPYDWQKRFKEVTGDDDVQNVVGYLANLTKRAALR